MINVLFRSKASNLALPIASLFCKTIVNEATSLKDQEGNVNSVWFSITSLYFLSKDTTTKQNQNLSFVYCGYPTSRIDMTSVNTNISASKAALSMSNANNAQAESAKRLSSGAQINGGSDDAAGIAVSSKMTAIFMGQKAAIKAATDAVSLLYTQEAAVEQLIDIIQRVRQLAVQMSNGTYSDNDRALAQLESDALMAQFLMVAENTRFNDTQLLAETALPPGQSKPRGHGLNTL